MGPHSSSITVLVFLDCADAYIVAQLRPISLHMYIGGATPFHSCMIAWSPKLVTQCLLLCHPVPVTVPPALSCPVQCFPVVSCGVLTLFRLLFLFLSLSLSQSQNLFLSCLATVPYIVFPALTCTVVYRPCAVPSYHTLTILYLPFVCSVQFPVPSTVSGDFVVF
jgi:hypothetical protein